MKLIKYYIIFSNINYLAPATVTTQLFYRATLSDLTRCGIACCKFIENFPLFVFTFCKKTSIVLEKKYLASVANVLCNIFLFFRFFFAFSKLGGTRALDIIWAKANKHTEILNLTRKVYDNNHNNNKQNDAEINKGFVHHRSYFRQQKRRKFMVINVMGYKEVNFLLYVAPKKLPRTNISPTSTSWQKINKKSLI